MLRALGFTIAVAVHLASFTAQAEVSNISGQTNGYWALNHRWIQTSGETEYGTLIVNLPKSEIYRICRKKGDRQSGVGTKELYVYIDDKELINYSLDHGSCLIGRGRKFALRYSGPDINSSHVLTGRYTRLAESSLESIIYEPVMRWSMSWVRGETDHHDVALIKDVIGEYRICTNSIAAELDTGTPGSVSLLFEVDGTLLKSYQNNVVYREDNCVDIAASNVKAKMGPRSPGLSRFFVEGVVLRKVPRL